MKIMIVDDHNDMRKMIKQVISMSNLSALEVVECVSGEEAVSTYARTHPDCVLMDFQLGAMNGLEATEIIYQNDANAHVIVLTGYDSSQVRQKAQNLGVYGFITKDMLTDITPLLQALEQNL